MKKNYAFSAVSFLFLGAAGSVFAPTPAAAFTCINTNNSADFGLSNGGTGQAVACGTSATATSPNGGTTAVGPFSTATGNNSTAFGGSAIASGVGVGLNNIQNTAIGAAAHAGTGAAGQNSSTALGVSATADASFATALGGFTQANNDFGVALGYRSVTSAATTGTGTFAINGVSFSNFVGVNPTGVVSVGDLSYNGGFGLFRQITNVAAGQVSASSSDAVNGSQLYSVAAFASNIPIKANNSNSLAQPTSTGTDSLAAGYGAAATSDRATVIGNRSLANGTDATAVGAGATANGDNSIAIGGNATQGNTTTASAAYAGATNSVAIGNQSKALSNSSVAVGAANIVTGTDASAVGTGNTLTGSSSAVTGSSNKVNGSQTNVTGFNNFVNYTVANHAGVSGNGNNINLIGSNNRIGTTANATGSAILGNGNSVNAQNAVAIGNGTTVTADGAVAIGQGAVADTANTVSVGNTSAGGQRRIVNVAAGIDPTDAVNVGQLQGGGLAGNFSSLIVANLSTTNGINNSGQTITNLGAGAIGAGSTDAVNGGQLFTANQRVAMAFGGGAGTDTNGQLTAPTYVIQGATFNNVGGALTSLDTAVTTNTTNIATNTAAINTINTTGTKYYQSNSTGPGASATGTDALAMGSGSQATQAGSIAIGLNSASTGANAIAIGTGAVATGSVAVGVGATASNGGAAFGDGAVATATNSTAVGPNSSATAANSVSVGSGSTNNVANTVSFGSSGNERRLTNVAAGISQTDAVNMGQFNSLATGIQSQIGGLQSQVYDNRREARQGIAAAFALTAAPMPSAPGKITYALNTGFFKSETAGGVSFAYRFNTAHPMSFNVGYAYGGGDSHGGRAGIAGEF